MLSDASPESQSLPLSVHVRDLQVAGWICIRTIAISGAVFGAAGAIFNINALLPGWFTGMSFGFNLAGAFIYFFYVTFCVLTYGASFLLTGIVFIFLAFFLLRLASLAVRVRLPATKRLITVSATAAGFTAGVVAVSAWQPLGITAFVVACLTAVATGITAWRKALPPESLPGPKTNQTPIPSPGPSNPGPSAWNDLE